MSDINNKITENSTLGSKTKGLGPLELAFFVVAAAGPLLVVAGFIPFAFIVGGIGAPGAQLFAGLVLLLFAVGFTRMAMKVHNRGAFYTYIGKSLGKPMGGGSAALAATAYTVITIAQFGAFGAFSSGTLSRLAGIDIDWIWLSLFAWSVVAWLGYRQISLSAKVLGVALLAEVFILIALAIPVLISGGPEGFSVAPLQPSNIFGGNGTGAMFAIVFGAFIGFESTAIYTEEARNPERTVPQATFLAVGFLTIFYTFMSWVIVVAFGESEIVSLATEYPSQIFSLAIEQYIGHDAAIVLELLLITSTFASSLSFHNTGARYLFTLGREGLLPKYLGKISETHGSPGAACLTLSFIAIFSIVFARIINLDPYLEVFIIGVAPGILAILLLQLLCSFSIVIFFRSDEAPDTSFFASTVAPGLSIIGLSIATWLITTNFSLLSGREGTINSIILSTLPIVFFIGVARTMIMRSKDPDRYKKLTETKLFNT